MNFSSKEYLPGSEERIEHLRKIINGRPVAILAAGPSIQELENRIKELKYTDICYFGLNNFFVQEKHILQKIEKHASVVMFSGREGLPIAIEPITNFLKRNEDNMFISSFFRDTFGLLSNSFDLKRFLSDFDKKLLFFYLISKNKFPNNEYPLHFIGNNSLLILIQLALIGKPQSIVIFGADGHSGENAKVYYYRQDEYEPKVWPQIDMYLINDTINYFNPLAPIAIKNTRKTFGLKPINILNCSKNSFYTPFPKVTYDEAFEYLVKGRKKIGKLDLRVPAEPKKPDIWRLFIEKIIRFWKKNKWNSFKVIALRVWRKFTRTFANPNPNKESYAK